MVLSRFLLWFFVVSSLRKEAIDLLQSIIHLSIAKIMDMLQHIPNLFLDFGKPTGVVDGAVELCRIFGKKKVFWRVEVFREKVLNELLGPFLIEDTFAPDRESDFLNFGENGT